MFYIIRATWIEKNIAIKYQVCQAGAATTYDEAVTEVRTRARAEAKKRNWGYQTLPSERKRNFSRFPIQPSCVAQLIKKDGSPVNYYVGWQL